MDIRVGDILEMKKTHPAQSSLTFCALVPILKLSVSAVDTRLWSLAQNAKKILKKLSETKNKKGKISCLTS